MMGNEKAMVKIDRYDGKNTVCVYDGTPTVFTETINSDSVYYIKPYYQSGKERIYGDTIEKKIFLKRKKSGKKPDNWWND